MAKVTLLAYTPNPEKIIAAAGKLCYSSATIDNLMDGLTDEKATDFVQMLAGMGHESPIEHVSFTFGIEGVSRALLAQITRHRIASYSVQSQRYVKEKNFSFVTPPEIEKDKLAAEIFAAAMQNAINSYNELAQILAKIHTDALIASGTDPKEAKRQGEKMAIEDARFVLPNACDTQMIVTMNARSLINFFHHRCCNRAQWEIREVAKEMLRLVTGVAPTLFCNAGPSCVNGRCPEGSKTCGKMAEVVEEYALLRQEAANGN